MCIRDRSGTVYVRYTPEITDGEIKIKVENNCNLDLIPGFDWVNTVSYTHLVPYSGTYSEVIYGNESDEDLEAMDKKRYVYPV